MDRKRKYISREQALEKMQRFCAYQDRCHQEVRSKLLKLGIYGDDLEEVMVELIREDFLNEERFARSYARGRFRFKQWGRKRIRIELERRQISAYCIRKAMEEIDPNAYSQTLKELLTRRAESLGALGDFEQKHKLAAYALRRGFEPELVWEEVNKMLNDDRKG